MTITWRPAVCDGFGLFIALAGGSTSGKTFSALRLARGIVGPQGRFAVLDTEGGRTSHYAPEFHFFEHRMAAPFAPHRFSEAAESAQEAGFGCLVIDNFSVEWNGPGGVLDQHEAILQRKAGLDEKQRMKFAAAAWGKVKPPHKAMMGAFLQLRIPIIFVLRAEEKTKPDAAGVPQNLGWLPLQDKRFIYEWTVSFTLHPETPGKPRYDLPFKCEGQHRKLFPEGQLIGEKAGAALWAWASSGLTKGAPAAAAGSPAPAAPAAEQPSQPEPAGPAPEPEPEPKAPSPAPNAGPAEEDDGFPTDLLPDGLKRAKPPGPLTAAQLKARDFADELLADVRRRASREDINALLNQRAVRVRMTRIAEAHGDIHRELLTAINSHITDVTLPATG